LGKDTPTLIYDYGSDIVLTLRQGLAGVGFPLSALGHSGLADKTGIGVDANTLPRFASAR
jgi:hypothetical protein